MVREIGRCEEIRKPESEKILGAANGNRFAVGLTERFEIWEVESLKRVQVIPRSRDATIRQLSDSGDYLITSEPASHEETQATCGTLRMGNPNPRFGCLSLYRRGDPIEASYNQPEIYSSTRDFQTTP